MEYKVCTRCVMDTTDSGIQFDKDGVCDNCSRFLKDVGKIWGNDNRNKSKFEKLVSEIKTKGEGQKYDSIIGLSGGLDSSYLLHVAVTQFKLRPLVFHVDGGWNTDLAVENVQNLVEKLDLELMTEVVNWKEMRDLQLAFFKSGVPNIDLPQDLAFISALYNFAEKNNIKYILNGGNFSTEGIRNPRNWGWYGTDLYHVHDIHKKFGTTALKSFPISGILNHKLYLRYIKGIKVAKPLDFIPYTKKIAEDTLAKHYGWRAYPQKHFESRFTKFFEGYWLPKRYGFDTRRVQFSSLIVTDQMSREQAILKLESSALDNETIIADKEYIASKLRVSVRDLDSYLDLPHKTYKDYKNQEWLFNLGSKVLQLIGAEKNAKR
ncbi:N-acetyl sugar amidotransferase [Gammaproteobacteria bacterium]|nr:N-acetyl sugar amidotransferase [Gammaproteobacteria bacterium]